MITYRPFIHFPDGNFMAVKADVTTQQEMEAVLNVVTKGTVVTGPARIVTRAPQRVDFCVVGQG